MQCYRVGRGEECRVTWLGCKRPLLELALADLLGGQGAVEGERGCQAAISAPQGNKIVPPGMSHHETHPSLVL